MCLDMSWVVAEVYEVAGIAGDGACFSEGGRGLCGGVVQKCK